MARSVKTILACLALAAACGCASLRTASVSAANNGTLYVYGDRAACGYCRVLQPIADGAEFKALVAGMGLTLQVADRTASPALYNTVRAKYNPEGGEWPKLIAVDAKGKKLGSFVARNTYIKPFNAATLVAKIKAACPGCSDPGTGTVPKICPTCGQVIPTK